MPPSAPRLASWNRRTTPHFAVITEEQSEGGARRACAGAVGPAHGETPADPPFASSFFAVSGLFFAPFFHPSTIHTSNMDGCRAMERAPHLTHSLTYATYNIQYRARLSMSMCVCVCVRRWIGENKSVPTVATSTRTHTHIQLHSRVSSPSSQSRLSWAEWSKVK